MKDTVTANLDALTDMLVENAAQCKDLIHVKQKAVSFSRLKPGACKCLRSKPSADQPE